MRAFVIAALLILLTSGCGGTYYTGPRGGDENYLEDWEPSLAPFSWPSEDVIHNGKIGTTLVRQGTLKSAPTIVLEEAFTSQWPRAGGYEPAELTYLKGAVLMKRAIAADGTAIYANNVEESERLEHSFMSGYKFYEIGLGLGENDKVKYIAVRMHPIAGRIQIKNVSFSKPLKITRDRVDQVNENNFRQEFIYSGRNDGELFFLYREFSGDMIRPAFSQNVTYAATGPSTMVAFRNLTLEVIEATNLDITYKVLSPF